MSEPTLIRLRYAGTCYACGCAVAARSEAWWDKDRKAVSCVVCGPVEVDPATATSPAEEARPLSGSAGASAAREGERRTERRSERIRNAHPHLGKLILAATEDPQSTRAWAVGAEGERVVGQRLDGLVGDGTAVLHDRRIPGSRANIDHIAVAPSGIFVIDAKHYKGKVERRDVGGLFHKDLRLFVGRRDSTKLVEAMANQISVVRRAIADSPESPELPVVGVLCFVNAEWPLFARPIEFENVVVTWPKDLQRLLGQQGALSAVQVEGVFRRLAVALPPA